MDANIGRMLGFSDIQLWQRKEDKFNDTTGAYKKQTIENKESYKWIKASNASKEDLNNAKSITIIEDREGDTYEQFCSIPDEKTHLLIRSRDDRNFSDGKKVHVALEEAKCLGEYKIEIKGDLGK
ncbi:MAG: hypothetical protein ACKVOM_03050 [Ferruginibacter sp.]